MRQICSCRFVAIAVLYAQLVAAASSQICPGQDDVDICADIIFIVDKTIQINVSKDGGLYMIFV